MHLDQFYHVQLMVNIIISEGYSHLLKNVTLHITLIQYLAAYQELPTTTFEHVNLGCHTPQM